MLVEGANKEKYVIAARQSTQVGDLSKFIFKPEAVEVLKVYGLGTFAPQQPEDGLTLPATADTLPPGMCFSAVDTSVYDSDGNPAERKHCQVFQGAEGESNYVYIYDSKLYPVGIHWNPGTLQVVEVYGVGTFRKKEVD